MGSGTSASAPIGVLLAVENAYQEGVKNHIPKEQLFEQLQQIYQESYQSHESKIAEQRKILSSFPSSNDHSNFQVNRKVVNDTNFSSSSLRRPHSAPSFNHSGRLRPSSAQSYNNRQHLQKSTSRKISTSDRVSNTVSFTMHYDSLWKLVWNSISAQVPTSPLPIELNCKQWLQITDNKEIISLIFLLKKISREFEGKVRWTVRMLGRKSYRFSGGVVRGGGGSSVSGVSQANARRPGLSNSEIICVTAVKIMDDCWNFFDRYISDSTPPSSNWRDEIEDMFLSQLQLYPTSKHVNQFIPSLPLPHTTTTSSSVNITQVRFLSLFGSSTLLAYYIIQSLQIIPKNEIPVKQNALSSKRGVTINLKSVLIRLVEAIELILHQEKMIHDYDTFELLLKALIKLILQTHTDSKYLTNKSEDSSKNNSNKSNSSSNINKNSSKHSVFLAWKTGPVIILYSKYNIHIELLNIRTRALRIYGTATNTVTATATATTTNTTTHIENNSNEIQMVRDSKIKKLFYPIVSIIKKQQQSKSNAFGIRVQQEEETVSAYNGALQSLLLDGGVEVRQESKGGDLRVNFPKSLEKLKLQFYNGLLPAIKAKCELHFTTTLTSLSEYTHDQLLTLANQIESELEDLEEILHEQVKQTLSVEALDRMAMDDSEELFDNV